MVAVGAASALAGCEGSNAAPDAGSEVQRIGAVGLSGVALPMPDGGVMLQTPAQGFFFELPVSFDAGCTVFTGRTGGDAWPLHLPHRKRHRAA
ncbi:MAG: hypothetical protein AMXMBFR34_05710 [Myxococcaceae bacterium]